MVGTYELAGEFPLKDAARVLAAEQTTGTWTEVRTAPKSFEERLAGRVVDVDSKSGTARVAFPLEIFEPENIPGLLSILAGNFFGLGSLTRARWVDVEFPRAFAKRFKGPRFGIEGVRKLVGTATDRRPHCGTIVKPKVGLDPRGTARVAKEAALGGLDFIKDDETLTDQSFCPFEDRLRHVMDALAEAKSETGQTTLYAVNVTADQRTMLERAERAIEMGANCIMMDVLTAGFHGLQALRDDASVKVPIHVHRAMHGAMTRSKDFGISMGVICKLTRLLGGDQLHTGSASGKMERPADLPVLLGALRDPWHGLNSIFPVSSGGMHPASAEREHAAFGDDFVLQAGGGVHGHPDGTLAGARALRQAVDAVAKGVPLAKHAKKHAELQKALDKWGHETYSYESFKS
ncbi:MAG: ribulose 1,5-bisphosphate carboxylase [Euryarchaeota archaeon]|nr:ribulose 1,5-bisphosphate carboxylase [Euryarchaeota archaeon]